MGTSLSGLTPATTFDGLLKTSDNEPLDGTLKTISDGSGVDSVLQLSDSALQVNGDLNIGTIHQAYQVLNDLVIKGNSGSTYLKYYTNNGNNLTNQFGIGNFLKYNTAIGDSTLPTTSSPMLRIKGSGTTSATTSLLVQNSAGTDLFKVVDDNTMFYHTHKFRSAGGYLYIDGEANANRSLRIGQNFTASSYDGHIFKTFDGTSYSEAMRITGANDQFVGIGETTPTARLHVKGSGNDNTTTSLLVQNSDAENIMTITDDGYLTYRTPQRELLTLGNGSVLKYGTNSSISALYNRASIYDGTNTTQFENGNVGIGNGTTTPTARLQVKGSGTTSATTSLLVQNSAGTDMLKVTDDGVTTIDGSLVVDFFTFNGNKITAPIGLKAFMQTGGFAISNDSSGAPASTMAYIKGSGTTSATNALLVQNSAGTDLFKVTDDRYITGTYFDAGIYFAGATVYRQEYVYHGNNSSGVLKIQPDSLSFSSTGGVTNDASAMFQLESTTKGFLPPRMTTTERDAISTPAAGLMVYNTDTNTAECWNGSAWMPMF